MGGGDAAPARMLSLLCDPQVEPRQVAELIRRQPALCARVLRVANSPYYGQSRTVKTLERAFLVLGIDAVRGIAAAACLERTAQVCQARGILNLEALLDHSIATAVAAEFLTRSLHSPAMPEAFIAGLLHDFGILVELAMNPEGMATLMAARRAQPAVAVHDLELRYLHITHPRCAAVAFEFWSLPHALIAAVAHHHDPMAALPRHRALASLINLGCTLAATAGFAGAFESHELVRNADAMRELDLDAERLDAAGAGLADHVRAFRGALAD